MTLVDYPRNLVAQRQLPDGSVVLIRPIAASDWHHHRRFVNSLSLQTRYQRLMSARCLLPGELREMVEIDYQRELALVAMAGIGGDEREVGVARYVRSDTDDSAEFAVVVADDWQHRGLGGQLVRSLRDAATAAGIGHLSGLTLATNAPMLRLARQLGFEVSAEPGDWTVKRIGWRQRVAATVQ